MKNVPTAEEFLSSKLGKTPIGVLPEILREFAKLHCEAQVKEITEKVKVVYIEPDGCATGDYYDVDKDSIITAYPLSNIK
jgi:hypothetical protein